MVADILMPIGKLREYLDYKYGFQLMKLQTRISRERCLILILDSNWKTTVL